MAIPPEFISRGKLLMNIYIKGGGDENKNSEIFV
jgi:hypothetical protein